MAIPQVTTVPTTPHRITRSPPHALALPAWNPKAFSFGPWCRYGDETCCPDGPARKGLRLNYREWGQQTASPCLSFRVCLSCRELSHRWSHPAQGCQCHIWWLSEVEGIKTLPGKSPRQNVPLGWGWPMLDQVFSAVSLLPLLLLSPPSFPRDWFLINILYPKLSF